MKYLLKLVFTSFMISVSMVLDNAGLCSENPVPDKIPHGVLKTIFEPALSQIKAKVPQVKAKESHINLKFPNSPHEVTVSHKLLPAKAEHMFPFFENSTVEASLVEVSSKPSTLGADFKGYFPLYDLYDLQTQDKITDFHLTISVQKHKKNRPGSHASETRSGEAEPKAKSPKATAGELEELTYDDICLIIANLNVKQSKKFQPPIQLRDNLWASLKTPQETLKRLEKVLEKYPEAIAVLSGTPDPSRQVTTMGAKFKGTTISQYTLYTQAGEDGEEIKFQGDKDPQARSVYFNVAFAQKRLDLSEEGSDSEAEAARQDLGSQESHALENDQHPRNTSRQKLMPPEVLDGKALEQILYILKDDKAWQSLGDKQLSLVSLEETDRLPEGSSNIQVQSYALQPVTLTINGEKLTFKYADHTFTIANLRKAITKLDLSQITATLDEQDIPFSKPYATQGEKARSLLCKYNLFAADGLPLQYFIDEKLVNASVKLTMNKVENDND